MLVILHGDTLGARLLPQAGDRLHGGARRHSDALAPGESRDETWPSGRSRPNSFRNVINFLAYHNEAYNQLLFYFVTQGMCGAPYGGRAGRVFEARRLAMTNGGPRRLDPINIKLRHSP